MKCRRKMHGAIACGACLLLQGVMVCSFTTTATIAMPNPLQQTMKRSTSHIVTQLNISSGAAGDGEMNQKKPYLTTAEQEQRAEERRRLERRSDVVIGKTSALEGSKDFEIDISSTEKMYVENSDDVEREVFQQSDRGLKALRMGDLEEAKVAFDRVFAMKPSAYLWQAGLVLFYLGDVFKAAECFAKNALLYEKKFGEPASEERIWRDASELHLRTSLTKKKWKSQKDKKKKKKDEVSAEVGDDEALSSLPDAISPEIPPGKNLPKETRKVVRIARELFAASVGHDHSRVILSRAKLRCIIAKPGLDRLRWKPRAWFFLGLHYDSIGKTVKAIECMKEAVLLSGGGGNADNEDIVNRLPLLHMSERNWFNDDEVVPYEMPALDLNGSTNFVTASIKDDVSDLSVVELRAECKKRGMPSNNEVKAALQEKLLNYLVTEAATDPEFTL
uniref:SAP domain-containing protein n=1 Tax=Leptocylindrus danicus TaxID=163516 RepID=A0A6U2NIM3_9STRA|mmetsp:Transcript_21719/g.32445  ORF Transcript_21719/g.32445 Transcript_21719/m.32445 type:complete len:447 (+) Transcript_21719:177-1517(+)|eukprot:CAMPEP_0116015066 /NCGR_PEP_ID=MMETSP0321-20121206/6625_1 /TAXON_ID=163516 /ORGANISM="Leptocylindrus danicus var. danicus, Strain B650" /LENGTH=446 /DNA_ID=CAMNT_0003484785 /DNA_START=161 /DNA_END=1501 /DNA_ORIENTATION=-